MIARIWFWWVIGSAFLLSFILLKIEMTFCRDSVKMPLFAGNDSMDTMVEIPKKSPCLLLRGVSKSST